MKEKNTPLTIKDLSKSMMDYRLHSLALLKTMDKAGVPLEKIDPQLMNAWAELDADLLEGLAIVLKLPPSELVPQNTSQEMLEMIKQGEKIKKSIIENLPGKYRKKVNQLLVVGELVVDESDVYAELPKIPPINCK